MESQKLCPKCGTPLSSGTCPQCTEKSNRVVHRDILLLVSLAAFAAALFLFTRNMAAKERELDANVAAAWYRQGEQQIHSGEVANAVVSLRRAATADRDNRTYALTLANALTAAGRSDESRQALLRLRESSPENAEINLYLARNAAKRGDVAEAVRYYQNALYGLWPATQTHENPQTVRVELIHFLLDHQDNSRALSEVLIWSSEIAPDSTLDQIEAGTLFLKAGDAQQALKHFSLAIAADRNNPTALAGAGNAAFQLKDYATASRYLEAVLISDHTSETDEDLLKLTRTILSNDPLGPHLTTEERNRRVIAAFDQSMGRLQNCLKQQPDSEINLGATMNKLKGDAVEVQSKLNMRSLRRDPDQLRAAMELVSKIEEATKDTCGPPVGMDQALLLIVHAHQGSLQ